MSDGSGDGPAVSNRRLWTLVIFLSVAVVGAAIQVRGAVLPTLETEFGAPEWQLGLVAAAGTLGYLTVILAVGSRAGSLDTRKVIVVGSVGIALALFGMGLAPAFGVFLAGIAIRGGMEGSVRALDRPLLGHFYPGRRGRIFNYYDMVWAVGAAAGPLAVTAALALGSWRLVYAGLGTAMLVVAALFWRLDTPSVSTQEQPLDWGSVGRLLRKPEVLAMMTALFFSTGVEGGLFTWLPYYATGELPEGLAGVTLTVMLLSYVPGRLVYGTLAERVGYLPLLSALVAALVPAVAYTFLVADGLAILAGVAVIGLLLSGIYPTMVAYGTDAIPEYSGPVNALAAATGSLGMAAVPAVMGVIIGGSSPVAAMRLLVVPLVVTLAILGVAGLAQRRRTSQSAAGSGG